MQYVKQIEIEEVLHRPEQYLLVDVRTAAEYNEGRILGSINIPLFDEAERERIGLVYRKSPRAARFLAMDIVSPKISPFVRKVHGKCRDKTPVALCWRGGLRSLAAVQLLGLAGIEALQLRGGYKHYRQHIYHQLENYVLKNQVIVLKGKSGTGKTDILALLADKGYPVLDLEKLANHRGSTFGGHELVPETQKNFDSLLLAELRRLEGKKWLLVEGESKRIGNVYLPDFLFAAMRNAPVIAVEGSLDRRVSRILRDYTPKTREARLGMYRALARLRYRLAKATFIELKQCLDREDYCRFVELILTSHYDKSYDHQLPGKEVLLTVNSDNAKRAAEEIAALLDNPLG